MELTDYTKEEAARLKALYQARKKSDPSLNQEALADFAGWSGQSVVSQYLNGRIPLNLPALLKFAAFLKFAPHEVSPRLAGYLSSQERNQAVHGVREAHPYRFADAIDLHPIETWGDETPLGADEVAIPYFKEVELAAGKGSEVMLETGGRKLRFGKRTLQNKGVPAEAAAAATVTGDSMEPVLPHGSTVAIDTTATRVVDGKLYAINHDGQLRVKLLNRLPGGGLRVRSYNAATYEDEEYSPEQVAEHITIVGRVFWYSVLI